MRSLKIYLMSRYGQEEVSEAFSGIHELIIKSLQSVAKVIINDKHWFELYGFDVLLDGKLKPWLIEVNASPALTGTTPSDYKTKLDLLDDTFTVIDMENFLSGSEEQIGGFDLICKGSPLKLPLNSTFKTHLGWYNNRKQQMKKLAKMSSARLTHEYTQEIVNGGSQNKPGYRK